jgi:hypothetical protein
LWGRIVSCWPVSNRPLQAEQRDSKSADEIGAAACKAAQQSSQSRNQTPAAAGGDRRNRLSHQEIVAAREEIKIFSEFRQEAS